MSPRSSLAFASLLGLAALLLTAAPAFAANQTLKISVTGPGIVSGAGIGCGNGATCETEVEEGTPVTLTESHSERTAFGGWEGCETENGAECTLTIGAAPIEVKAEFTPIAQEELKVQTTGEGAVNGTSPGGEFAEIHCGNGAEPCHAEYNQGATIILFASRDPHNKFTGWEECPNVLSAGEYGTAECEVTLNAATEVKAKFTPIPQAELEVEVAGAGAVTSSPGGIACTSGTCKEHFDTEGPESTVTLTATANPDNHFEEWEGECESTSGGECTVTMSAARSVKAVFAPTMHKLTVAKTGPGEVTSSPPGIICGEDLCEAEFQEGSAVTLTASPQPHNHVTWGEGECKAEPGPNHEECEVEIGAAETIVHAAFSINIHTLTATTSGPGTLSATSPATGISGCPSFGGSCTGEYPETSTVTLTASPHAHYHFGRWEGCTHESENTCEVTIGPADQSVRAIFRPNTLTVTVLPSGVGSIRADSGTIGHCTEAGGTCSGPYIEVSTLTLIATPGPHQAVAWKGCVAEPSPNECEVEIGSADVEVRAAFAPITHALTLAKVGTGEGQLTCNGGPCASRYPEGTALTLAASPAAGSTFAGWSGGGCSGTGACNLTLNADTTITATFNAKPPPPAEEHCVVPALTGKTLTDASSALTTAHCTLGTVSKPKPRKGHKLGPLVIKSSSPAAGTTLPVDSKVNLTLGPKPRKKH